MKIVRYNVDVGNVRAEKMKLCAKVFFFAKVVVLLYDAHNAVHSATNLANFHGAADDVSSADRFQKHSHRFGVVWMSLLKHI